jgi:nucleoside-diphosphate-sugar epimerase
VIGITGSTSFLGRNLLVRLRDLGQPVRSFDGDICDPADVAAFVQTCETIYHLAGCNRGAEKDVYEINMLGGANVTAAAAALGDRHVIFPSSNYVRRFPQHPYSVSKASLEGKLRSIAGFNGCRVTVFRLPNVYGPLALPFHVSVVATFCWYEARGLGDRMPIFGDGSQAIELLPVDSVTSALVEALTQKTDFSLTEMEGERLAIRELAEIIRDPAKRAAYPALEATVAFFSRPCDHRLFSRDEVRASGRASFEVTTRDDVSITLDEVGEKVVEPGYQRSRFEDGRDGSWLCVKAGKVAVDLFAPDDGYCATVLLDGADALGMAVPPGLRWKIRNVGADAAIVGRMSQRLPVVERL